MKIFTTKKALQVHLNQNLLLNKKIGFVATMGALHSGHISLIQRAKSDSDLVVCSIFVNPTQFNDPKDLEKYPRTIEADIKLLQNNNCDILFNPSVEEIYDINEQWHLDLGDLEFLLEGKTRPGHYQGVTQIVYKLFKIVKPDFAYFGQKDFQQFKVISTMVKKLEFDVKLIMCPIMREFDGLAMSSRNIHLTPNDHKHALILSKTLVLIKNKFDRNKIQELKQEAFKLIHDEPGVEPDYFEIVDADTLHPANENTPNIVALVAAKVGKTRLIDNIVII